MYSLGFLTLNIESERLYFTEIAKRAHRLNSKVYIFTPNSIDPHTELVKGLRFCSETFTWRNDTFPIPASIYDRCFYQNEKLRKQFSAIVNWLKQKPDISFLGYGLPNKWTLYNELNQSTSLSPYLINTTLARNEKTVYRQLTLHDSILLKPIRGSQGKGIMNVTTDENEIKVSTQRHKKLSSKIFSNETYFLKWMKSLLQNQSFIIQPFLPLKTKNEQPFDIRILLQKNEKHEWIEQGRGVRCGTAHMLTSNIHNGANVITFDQWIRKFSKHKQQIFIDEIETIITHLTTIIDQKFNRVFEMGIDIGVSIDGSIWLLDVNSKPGRNVILQTCPSKMEDIYEAPLHYSRALQSIML